MGHKKIPYLCGGTLFFLLVQAKKPRARARERERGTSDGLSDPEMMEGLIRAITGRQSFSYESSLKKNTSQFRECKIDGSTYIPFNDPATASGYDAEISDNYAAALARMVEFADSFLDPAKATWLVRALLDGIALDEDVKDSDRLCVKSDGSFRAKAEILSMPRFELQPFLIGIVHYILMNRSDNKAGYETLEAWGTKEGARSERKLKGDFSLGARQTASVSWYEESMERGDRNQSAAESEQDEESEAKEARPAEGDEPSETVEWRGNTYIDKQVNLENSAVNHYDIKDSTVNFHIQIPEASAIGSAEQMMAIQSFSHQYYQLLVTCEEDVFQKNAVTISNDRALNKSLVPPEIFERCSTLSDAGIRELKTFPAIVCQENTEFKGVTDPSQWAVYAYITKVQVRGKEIKVSFQPIAPIQQRRLCAPENSVLFDLNMDCAITDLNRSAWSVHKVNLFAAMKAAGIGNVPMPGEEGQ